MSFGKNPLNQVASNDESLPKTVAEVKAYLKSPGLAMGLLTRIQQESGQKIRWAEKYPVCAKELVQTLFSKAKLSQVVAPFFSLCAQDPALKKALRKIASEMGAQAEAAHETLERNIGTIAQDPGIFFSLGHEALDSKNRRLALTLLAYCGKNRAFIQNNVKHFSKFVKEVVQLQDLVILEDIFVKGLDGILEKNDDYHANNGGLELGSLYNYKKWGVLDLLIQQGKVSSMSLSSYWIGEGLNPEKIDLLLANGAIVGKPSDWENNPTKKQRQERAYAFHLMYQKLHSKDLTVEYLRAQNSEHLWDWLCLDRNAASVLPKHPDFFVDFLTKQLSHSNSFDQALKAYTESVSKVGPGLSQSPGVEIPASGSYVRNIDPLAGTQPRELSRSPGPTFEALSVYVSAGIFDPIALGIPLLFKAISSNRCEMARTLIHCGVPVNAIDPQSGWSVLEAVMRSLDLGSPLGMDLFQLLLNHPTTDCRALFKDKSHPIDILLQSNLTNKHPLLKAMLDKGFSLRGLKFSLIQNVQSIQPYDVPTFKLLISRRIPLDEQSADGDSLLHVLIRSYSGAPSGKRNAYLQLITHLAIFDPKRFDGLANKSGKFAMDIAQEFGLLDVIMILLHAGMAQSSPVMETLGLLPILPDWLRLMNAYVGLKMPTSMNELQQWLTPMNLELFFGDAIFEYGVYTEATKDNEAENAGDPHGAGTGFVAALLSVYESKAASDAVEAVARARHQLKSATQCHKILDACVHNKSFKKSFLPVLSACVETQIALLPLGEALLVPSGWRGAEGAHHAVLVEIQKNFDGTYSLLVINTDNKNGGEFHLQKPTGLKDLMQPVRAFSGIPLEKLLDASLIPSLFSLLSHIPEDGAGRYTQEDLYYQLFWRFNEYASVLPSDKQSCFIVPQRSGSCTVRAPLAYLHYLWGTQAFKKRKTEIEWIIFQAMNDPAYLGKSSANPHFLKTLEHALERSALHLNTRKKEEQISLEDTKEYAALLEDVRQKVSGIDQSSKSSKQIDKGTGTSLCQRTAASLSECRKTYLEFNVDSEIPTPSPLLVPPAIDFSTLRSGEEWMGAIDQLNGFFEQSFKHPLDPHQRVATHFTTQALMMLSLPSKGVFQPKMDDSLFGSLSIEQKRALKEKIGTLCQRYATALYNQREAISTKERLQLGFWGYDNYEPMTEAESVEQYLCINKLFAHYWRLCLALDDQEGGLHSLRHYGIDISHLAALKNSIHLPCYSPQAADQLNDLIAFFEQSHPDPTNAHRTLLKIESWFGGEKVQLPLYDQELKKEPFGDPFFCEEWYRRLPEACWGEVDKKWERLSGWRKPDLKKWRLAHLFAHPERFLNSPGSPEISRIGLELYDHLRKIAFTCWFFKRASHEKPICFEEIKWEKDSLLIESQLIAKSKLQTLATIAHESSNPSHVGKLGHGLLMNEKSALERNTKQNDYTILWNQNSSRNQRRFYEIAQASEFSISRLLVYYQENISDLRRESDQIFFQLVLFGKEQIAEAVKQDPSIGNQVLHLIQQALQEFDHLLQVDPMKDDLLKAITFLNGIKLRLDAYLPGCFPENARQKLQQEIERRLENSAIGTFNKAELLLLWICAQSSSSWTDPEKCERALVYLNHFEFAAEHLDPSHAPIDPTLKALSLQEIFVHLNDLKKVFAHPAVLARATRQICSAYGIRIAQETAIEGAFPQVHFVENGHLYEIHLLIGEVARDKTPLLSSIKIETNPVVREFSKGRSSPIETHVVSRTDKMSRFYALSEGNEYYFTVYESDEKNWATQAEWNRGSETFYYMPFDTVPEELKRLALAAPPKKDNYYYWVSKSSSSIAAIIQNRATGVEEVILYADGTVERASKSGKWNYVEVESIPELSILASMQPKEQIAVWNQSGYREVHCYGLKDTKGAHLTFQTGTSPSVLNVLNHSGYRISRDQTVKGFGRHFPYLVIENEKGEKKALVPVKTWSEVASESKDVERSYSYEEIAIDKQGNPVSMEIKQRLLLAYYFIGAKKYGRALGLLKQSESARVYTPEELKMLGWILLHSKETGDLHPKAVSLSLIAACLVKQNLDQFPDAYSPLAGQKKITSFYEESKAWPQFWKGHAPWEKTDSKHVNACIGEALDRYYQISSHCPGEFQIHGKRLTAFQEMEWLMQILKDFPNSLLLHRLRFLLSGKPSPLVAPEEVQCSMSFNFSENMAGFDWLHSIDVSEDVLSSLHRTRPEKGLREEFGKLYALASKGTPEEKEQLLHFLRDMQHDPDEVNQLIRAILMSQLPPYNSGPPYSDPNGREPRLKNMTIPQAIADKVGQIAKDRHREDGTLAPFRSYYGNHSPEAQLTKLVRDWQEHFFPIVNKQKQAPVQSVITLNLPPLPEQKKERLCAQYAHFSDQLIEEMNLAAEGLFFSQEKPCSTTSFPPLPATLQNDAYFQMRGKSLRKDIEEGKIQNQSKARYCLKEKADLLSLQKDLRSKKDQLHKELKARKKEILDLVSQVRGGSSREIEAQLLRLGKKDVPPKLDECICLFVQRDLALFKQRMPFLNSEDCLKLNVLIGQYLLVATTKQRLARSLEKLDKVIARSQTGKSLEKPIHELAIEMKKKREFTASEHPEMLVLEYYDDISLRKEQCENLIKMTTTDSQGKFRPMLVQMIMSAGKTSILGTLLALMKADGYHLSILFTPRSLLDTNAAGMKERNEPFFGQRGYTFTFNRGEKYFNTLHLLKLQCKLLHAIERREYLILAPETLLSMQNQYIEAREKIRSLRKQIYRNNLKNREFGKEALQNFDAERATIADRQGASEHQNSEAKPTQPKTDSSGCFGIESTPRKKNQLQQEIEKWEAPAQQLKMILRLFRKRGAATFDEIDTQYSPRGELNYPGIETTKLDRISVELVSALYEIASTDPDLKKIGLNLSENTQSHLIPSQIQAIKPLLAKKMLQVILANPLWCQHLGLRLVSDPAMTEELTAYFLNLQTRAPKWVSELSASASESDRMAAERIVLIRQEIAQWLPSCWKYSADEHFSRSKEHPDYLAAKPNICASTPNESAEIAHCWELVNKTLQLYVSTGVDLNQTKTIVESLQKLAIIQLRKTGADSAEKTFDRIPIVENFRSAALKICIQDLELMKLNVNDQEAMKQVQKVLNAKTPESIRIIIQYLRDQVFPELKFHRDQIHNNTANLSAAVDSEQGYSGTTDNLFIFSHAFMQDPENRIILDKGAYGKVIDVLCRKNRVVNIVGPHLKTPEDLMKAIHQKKPIEDRNRFHAFIDTGAYFKGYTNSQVAYFFLNYFSHLDQSPIEGILYFDDTTNQLACLKKGHKDPILLNSTDAQTISAMTGLKKEQLFTHYDPFHIIGTNILQYPPAKAFSTTSGKTDITKKLQGDMRMRGLFEEQEIEEVVPEDLIPLISHLIEQPVGALSIEQILLFCEINSLLADKEDNLKAFSLKLNAAARKYVLDKLYDSSSIEEEEALYAVSRTFFIKLVSEELFSQYGAPPQSIDADAHIAAQIQYFFEKIQWIEPHLPDGHAEALRKELQEIASISKSYIPSKIDTLSLPENTTVEKIADVEKKLDNLSELNLDAQRNLSRDEKPTSAPEISWSFNNLGTLQEELFSPLSGTLSAIAPKFQKLSDAMNANGDYALFSDSFTPEFLLSNNFIQTVSDQTNLFDSFQKTPYEALLFKGPFGQYHLLLLTTAEARGFLYTIEKHEKTCSFSLLNASGAVRAGAPIDPSPETLQLIIQMLFFSGRLSLLEQQKWQQGLSSYLSVNRAMKRDLFEAVILGAGKFLDYEHSTLKQLLNAPSKTASTKNPVLKELKAAFFALRRGNWHRCKESVEKHFNTLAKDRPEEISTVIAIANTLLEPAKSQTQSQWAADLLLELLPHLKDYAQSKHYQPIQKMIEVLKAPIDRELSTQIVQTLIQIPELPADLLKAAYEICSHFAIDQKTEVPVLIECLKSATSLLSKFEKHPLFEELIAMGGKNLLKTCLPESKTLSKWSHDDNFIKNATIFQAIMALLRDKQADLLLRFARPFLTEYLNQIKTMRLESIEYRRINEHLSSNEKIVSQFYADLKTFWGICAETDQMFDQHLIQPIIQHAYQQDHKTKEYSETEGACHWEASVDALNETKIPYAMEQAENLRLKFQRDDQFKP